MWCYIKSYIINIMYIILYGLLSTSGNSRSGFGSSRNQGGFGGSRGGFNGGTDGNDDDMLEVEISSRDIARIIGMCMCVFQGSHTSWKIINTFLRSLNFTKSVNVLENYCL